MQRIHRKLWSFPLNHQELCPLFVCGAQWLKPQGLPTRGRVFPVLKCCPSVNDPASRFG